MLRDIHDLTDEREAYADELSRRGGGKGGPFRVESEALPGPDGGVAVRALLDNEGNADKAITSGSYLFRTEAPR